MQSGLGFVHNTYLLERPQKTVLKSPLSMFPKPVWFSTHRRPESVAWRLCELYGRPSLWRIPAVLSGLMRLSRLTSRQNRFSAADGSAADAVSRNSV